MEQTINQINNWLKQSKTLAEFLKLTGPKYMLEQGATLKDYQTFIQLTQQMQITCTQIWYGYDGRGLVFQEQVSADLTGVSDKPEVFNHFIESMVNFLTDANKYWGLDKIK